MKRTLQAIGVIVCIALAGLAVYANFQRQKADNDWVPTVDRPAFTTVHPRVVIDEAHYNPHTARGKYRPFARLLEADGYQVARGEEKLSAESLADAAVLVIVNAAGGPRPEILGINLPIPTRKKREMPAFTSGEIEAVRTWVATGGSLLLIADHAPSGTSAAALAAAFGVRMNQGFVEAAGMDPGQRDPSNLVFSNQNGFLGEHAIVTGDRAEARVRRVVTFLGQSLDGPPEAAILLRLPESAVEYVPPGPELREQRAGRAQGLALEWKKGRVVVLGEASMLTAQVNQGVKMGMNVPGNDNRQFALNILHWLSRRL